MVFQSGEKDEYSHRQKELEDLFNPIITKMYKEAGGGPEPGKILGHQTMKPLRKAQWTSTRGRP